MTAIGISFRTMMNPTMMKMAMDQMVSAFLVVACSPEVRNRSAHRSLFALSAEQNDPRAGIYRAPYARVRYDCLVALCEPLLARLAL